MWFLFVLFLFPVFAESTFFSQYSQDQFLYENFFKGKKDGVFVEIGAHDGITFSNTYFFEKELGWRGLCIEPIPEVFEKLKKTRAAICFQGCIAEKNGPTEFVRIKGFSEMLSGIKNKYHPLHLQRIESEGGEKETIQVECSTLNDLCAKEGIGKIDYLSIDTEGGEFDILKSIDFEKLDIDLISVENNYKDNRLKEFLTSKGYVFITSISCDEIYKKPSFEPYLNPERPSLHFIQQFLPENPVIVEAGAHLGGDTVIMSRLWKNGMIYAFEPSPSVYKKLKKACRKKKNIQTFDVALGDKIGKVKFYESTRVGTEASNCDAQGSLFPPSKENWAWPKIGFQKPIEVSVTTLDDWARSRNLKKIDFLWLDMQGSEFSMLKASPEILKTVKVIQTEVSRRSFYEGTVVLDVAKAWLEKQGFQAIYITPDEHGDGLFVRKNK